MNFFSHWMLLQAIVLLFAYPLAKYIYLIQRRQYSIPVENTLFKVLGISREPMDWQSYLYALLKFQLLGWLFIYGLARFSHLFPAQAFQLASSFVTNTNWQSFPGEGHWNLPLWLFGIIGQNFLSAATGLCVLLVFARCFKARQSNLGNFYVDIWRMTIYVLLPIGFLMALPLIWQGVPQNFSSGMHIQQYANPQLSQYIPMGPIAAEESIKLLGTNGGGYTASNSAHPFENPSLISHYIEMFLMLLLPCMGAFLFTRIYGHLRYGWFIWLTMLILSTILVFGAYVNETPNLLGKELRLGSLPSVLWHGITTATATGATSAVVDQFQPVTTGFYLFLINLGELAFGGVGLGVVNLLFLFILSGFILGLLTGSSPIFLKNKISIKVIKLSMFYIIFIPSFVLIGLILWFASLKPTLSDVPYLVSAAWYAISSWLNNNGSGFSGVSFNAPWMHYLSGVLMLIGRYVPIVLAFTVCGIIAKQQVIESNKHVVDLDSYVFVLTSIVVIFIVTVLAFLPLWSLGPLALQGLI